MIHISDWLPTFAKLAGYNVDGGIDGVDVWPALTDNLPKSRNEVLAHHDLATPFMAYISDNFKLMVGTANKGRFDRWLSTPIEPTEQNSTFGTNYGKAILSSVGGRVLSKYSQTKEDRANRSSSNPTGMITANEITEIRSKAQITCNGFTPPNENAHDACHPLVAPCLFDVFRDPCETTNLASKFPEIVQKLKAKLDYYSSIAAPFRNKPADPQSNPADFNGVWTWWRDELNNHNK